MFSALFVFCVLFASQLPSLEIERNSDDTVTVKEDELLRFLEAQNRMTEAAQEEVRETTATIEETTKRVDAANQKLKKDLAQQEEEQKKLEDLARYLEETNAYAQKIKDDLAHTQRINERTKQALIDAREDIDDIQFLIDLANISKTAAFIVCNTARAFNVRYVTAFIGLAITIVVMMIGGGTIAFFAHRRKDSC